MSRDKNYQRMLNSKRWTLLRDWKRRKNPICERCWANGEIVTKAVDIHHIVPVESASSVQDMERLCFDPANLMSVCVPCHIALHKELKSHKRDQVQANKRQAVERWAENRKVKDILTD